MFLVPGATADVVVLDVFGFELPSQSTVYSDSAFTRYAVEDLLYEACGIDLSPMPQEKLSAASLGEFGLLVGGWPQS